MTGIFESKEDEAKGKLRIWFH